MEETDVEQMLETLKGIYIYKTKGDQSNEEKEADQSRGSAEDFYELCFKDGIEVNDTDRRKSV